MNKILEHILSIPKSFYVSLKYFSLKDAVKLPIMVRYNTVLLGLKGKITNSGGAKFAMFKVGFGNVGVFDKKYERTMLQIGGTIELSDKKVCFGHGSRICVYPGGVLRFNGEFNNSTSMTIICSDHITFGDGVLSSWDTLVMDTDLHESENPVTKEVYPSSSPVVVGDNAWICARSVILKGCKLPKGCILSAASVLTRKYDEEFALLAGSPAIIKRHNITIRLDYLD